MDTTSSVPISGTVCTLYSRQEGVIIKRVFLDSGADLYLHRSDAHGYPEASLEPNALTSRLMGRVVWVLQHI